MTFLYSKNWKTHALLVLFSLLLMLYVASYTWITWFYSLASNNYNRSYISYVIGIFSAWETLYLSLNWKFQPFYSVNFLSAQPCDWYLFWETPSVVTGVGSTIIQFYVIGIFSERHSYPEYWKLQSCIKCQVRNYISSLTSLIVIL